MGFNENIGTVLGQKVSYSQTYDPAILVREPRARNREKYGLVKGSLPFVGFDNWNCYEISFLLDNGYPISRVARVIYSCRNDYLVESKSLKLYLNSFNMTKWGETVEEAEAKVRAAIEKDLRNLLETDVVVKLFSEQASLEQQAWMGDFTSIEKYFDPAQLEITHYNEAPEVLDVAPQNDHFIHYKLKIDFLRSNCKITHQPDWGVAFIDIHTPTAIDISSLARYLISFRNENHFHEEVCEMIFKRLYDKYNPVDLFVGCFYTRRGGIDICPMRTTDVALIPEPLQDFNLPYSKLLQQ